VNNCNFDLSGTFLRQAYGDGVRPRATARASLRWIDQFNYIPNDATAQLQDVRGRARSNATRVSAPERVHGQGPHLELPKRAGMLRYAIAYAPASCVDSPRSCKVTINYHGCMRSVCTRLESRRTPVRVRACVACARVCGSRARMLGCMAEHTWLCVACVAQACSTTGTTANGGRRPST
jgi:hypothetical protein